MRSPPPLDPFNPHNTPQDHHGYPVVQRDLQGLLQSSQTARARTSRVRSAADQAAASRLLANQGFDASRLQQDVAMLELAPHVSDVFAGDSATVDEYLAQIQEMTILTAIQVRAFWVCNRV